MSITAKPFHYVGKHCFQACTDSHKGKMCQCKFDRKYERQCFEDPQNVTPAIVSGAMHEQDVLENNV